MAWQVDTLFFYLMAVSAFFTLLIFVAVVYLALKYRRRVGNEQAQHVKTNYKLEVAWTVIPFLLTLVMFGWGAQLFVSANRPPAGAMEIYVMGKQWMWKIQHPSGRKEINELHVPRGRPVLLNMTSQDVIHDFGLPDFRIKKDVIPGTYTYEWFTATEDGEYYIFCDQYCGALHSEMVGKVVVMEPQDYAAWAAGAAADESPVRAGERLFTVYGCSSCHGQRAPTLAGVYMSKVELEGGGSVVADEQYLRESIVDPSAKFVKGFGPWRGQNMPTFKGQLSDEQIYQLIAYIKSLQSAQSGTTVQPVPENHGVKIERRVPGVQSDVNYPAPGSNQ